MTSEKTSGQEPFVFTHRKDLSVLPSGAREQEVNLHGGFAIDDRPGHGHIYYGMPGAGIMRIDPDLQKQEIIGLPEFPRDEAWHIRWQAPAVSVCKR